jgi:outer membrane protein OmpA-like peptidoglycan-associated protein
MLIAAFGLAAGLVASTTSYATTPPMYLILFPTDDVALGEAQEAVLDNAIEAFRSLHKARFTITGHYDRTGTREHRAQMSRRYAEAVAEYLVENGLPKGVMAVSWRADEEPSVPTEDGVYEPSNRYVVVVIDAQTD